MNSDDRTEPAREPTPRRSFRHDEVTWLTLHRDEGVWRCLACGTAGQAPTGVNAHTWTNFEQNIRWEHRYCGEGGRRPPAAPRPGPITPG